MCRIRRVAKAFMLIATTYTAFYILNYLLNETAGTSIRYPKAIEPSEDDKYALRQAIVECKFNSMYANAPSKCSSEPLVLLLVTSSPNNILRRSILRQYFASVPALPLYRDGPAWRLVFIISRTNNQFLETKITKEIAANDDVILGRYRDSKRNHVYKTLISLGWATCSCPPRYLLKANDDVFINLRIMIYWLFQRTNGTFHDSELYSGISTIGHFPRPIRDRANELYVPKDEYPHETYAPYIIGSAFLVSKDVLHRVTRLIPHYPAFSAEDAYFGMLARTAGVSLHDNTGFIRYTNPYTWSTCNYRRIFLSLHALAKYLPRMLEGSLRSERQCLPTITLFPDVATRKAPLSDNNTINRPKANP